jgi:hypothetical protein
MVQGRLQHHCSQQRDGKKHPGKFIYNTNFDPRDGDLGLEELKRNVESTAARASSSTPRSGTTARAGTS